MSSSDIAQPDGDIHHALPLAAERRDDRAWDSILLGIVYRAGEALLVLALLGELALVLLNVGARILTISSCGPTRSPGWRCRCWPLSAAPSPTAAAITPLCGSR